MNNNEVAKFKGTPYIIKNKNSSTIDFILIYSCKYEKKHMFYLSLIKQLLLTTSFEYPTEDSYKREYKESMIINQSISTKKLNNNLYIMFKLTVPNPKKLNGYDIERAFKFFSNIIYKPNTNGKEFNKKAFEREQSFLKEDILYSIRNVYTSSYQAFLKIVDDNGILKDNIYNNMDLIDSANSSELYNVYKELIMDNRPIIIAYGDVDKSITNLIEKYLNINNKNIIIEKNYYNYLKPYEKPKIVEECSKYNQSILYVAYKVKDMTKKDNIYLNLVKNILGVGSNSLIFKSLRIENNLVYESSTWCNMYAGILVIEAYINNRSKDIIINKIEEVINSLKDKAFLQKEINELIENIRYALLRDKDSKSKKVKDFIMEKLDYGFKSETLIEKYININIEELIEFIGRLQLDTIYFLKGEFDEK